MNPTKVPLIDFVRSRTETSLVTLKSQRVKKKPQKSELIGEEVKTFYESIISESSNPLSSGEPVAEKVKSSKNKCRSKAQGRIEKVVELNSHRNDGDKHCESRTGKSVPNVSGGWNLVNKLLQGAQEGDSTGISRCLEEGVDVDAQDRYGWTALMCAACSGHGHIVRLLLYHKSRKDLRENRRRTARDLALHAGHADIVTLIDKFDYCSQPDQQSCKSNNGFYCGVCKCWFYTETERAHSTSTLHLFNCKMEPKKPEYLISESNVGYQMMLKSGWNESSGLGPEGQGRKYPVKTVLKRNRKGLGKEEESPRVTHFKPRDTRAVKSDKSNPERNVSVRVLSRRAMRRKERKERDWERRLRQYMNSE